MPRKIQLPPLPDESPALRTARLGAQARLNGATVTRPATEYHWGPSWYVTSQRGEGGYTVTFYPPSLYRDQVLPGLWECGCEAHTAGKLCAHIALVRTRIMPCLICGAACTVFAPAETTGAVYCRCGLVGDLTRLQTDHAWGAFHGIEDSNLLGVLWALARTLAAPVVLSEAA